MIGTQDHGLEQDTAAAGRGVTYSTRSLEENSVCNPRKRKLKGVKFSARVTAGLLFPPQSAGASTNHILRLEREPRQVQNGNRVLGRDAWF